jgi:uncharacterized protein (DUF2147 family)
MFSRLGLPAITVLAATLLGGSLAFASPPTSATSPLGIWSTEDGQGAVEIAQCGDALCGRIVGLDRSPGEPMPTDVYGQPECGLTIISNEKPQADGGWLGQVTDPRDGTKYHAKLWVDERGNLRLRGYLGIPLLGSTQVWHPFKGHLTEACGLA